MIGLLEVDGEPDRRAVADDELDRELSLDCDFESIDDTETIVEALGEREELVDFVFVGVEVTVKEDPAVAVVVLNPLRVAEADETVVLDTVKGAVYVGVEPLDDEIVNGAVTVLLISFDVLGERDGAGEVETCEVAEGKEDNEAELEMESWALGVREFNDVLDTVREGSGEIESRDETVAEWEKKALFDCETVVVTVVFPTEPVAEIDTEAVFEPVTLVLLDTRGEGVPD